jgi:hypothetical protein
MRTHRLLIMLIAYVAFDLADPVIPGAFSFEVENSPIEQTVRANRPRQHRSATVLQAAPSERRAEPRDNSVNCQSPSVVATAQLVTKWAPPHPAPRSALLAPAPSPDDH